MKIKTSLRGLVLAVVVAGTLAHAQVPAQHKTQNVIVVMMDGMRWQEVFRGADPALLNTLGPEALDGGKERAALAQKRYGLASADERRAALMPFLWSTVAKEGQIFGNRDLGSDSHVTNPLHFSYPGYAETLTGIVDPRISSNDNVPNPNVTVFEWRNRKPEFAGKVAAFGAWEVFDGIFNKQRCGCVVNAGYAPLTEMEATPEIKLLNELKTESVHIWPDEAFDPMPFHTAVEYIKAKKPRVIFLGLGETDDWAHAGSYAEYLNAAHLNDSYLQRLWEMMQAMPEYRGTTTMIVLPDHGRGVGEKWTTHGEKVPESRETWMAFVGPDTPALGERKGGPVVTESEIAATVAALLGEDFKAEVPKAGAAIGDVTGRR